MLIMHFPILLYPIKLNLTSLDFSIIISLVHHMFTFKLISL